MVVTEKTDTCYTVKEEKTGKFYERTVGNVAPYTPTTVDVVEASGSSSEEHESFVEGNLLAVMHRFYYCYYCPYHYCQCDCDYSYRVFCCYCDFYYHRYTCPRRNRRR